MSQANQTVTITLCDRAENHAGMQQIGEFAPTGFTYGDLSRAKRWFEEKGIVCELHHLNQMYDESAVEDAFILVARKGLDALIDGGTADDFYKEQLPLEKDTKAFMRGRVVNKKARHNLCFADKAQDPDYESGKGRIIPFHEVPILNSVRENLVLPLGDKARKLVAEGNYYYDVNQCYVGFHGDAERKRVIGVRTGHSYPLHYQWYLRSEPVGRRLKINLNHGDVYVMSQKAVGTDWLKKITPTLRHAAGFESVLKIEGPAVSSCELRSRYLLDDEGYAVIKLEY